MRQFSFRLGRRWRLTFRRSEGNHAYHWHLDLTESRQLTVSQVRRLKISETGCRHELHLAAGERVLKEYGGIPPSATFPGRK